MSPVLTIGLANPEEAFCHAGEAPTTVSTWPLLPMFRTCGVPVKPPLWPYIMSPRLPITPWPHAGPVGVAVRNWPVSPAASRPGAPATPPTIMSYWVVIGFVRTPPDHAGTPPDTVRICPLEPTARRVGVPPPPPVIRSPSVVIGLENPPPPVIHAIDPSACTVNTWPVVPIGTRCHTPSGSAPPNHDGEAFSRNTGGSCGS